LRYGLASAIALGADAGTLVALKELTGMNVLMANTISFTVGLVVTFVASRLWVFSGRKIASPAMEFAIFVLVGLAGLAVNDLFLWLGTTLGWHYLAAKALAAGTGFLWNFALRKYLIYR
jgi:putative flippase GtrA